MSGFNEKVTLRTVLVLCNPEAQLCRYGKKYLQASAEVVSFPNDQRQSQAKAKPQTWAKTDF